MFGSGIDYHLLKPFCHSRNRATESELNERAQHSTFTRDEARNYCDRMVNEFFEERFPINPELSYLDIGCGMGRLSYGLNLAGIQDVTGIDIVERHVEEAKDIARKLNVFNPPEFHHVDVHSWEPRRQYDVIITLGAMEHIHDPGKFLARLPRLLKPGGRAFVSFEPFHSPIGDHMNDFFRILIPWRGLIFSEKAVLRLRGEFYRPTDPAQRYQDIVGGLNLMRFTQYLQWADEAGFDFSFHNFNPQLKKRKRYYPLQILSAGLTRVPRLRDFFGMCVYSILERKSA